MNNQNNGLKRDTIDKFYTINSVVDLCINTIKTNIYINKKDLIIEPSAGGGAFIKYLKLLTKKQIFLDIAPQHKEIIKQDYLTFDHIDLVNDFPNYIHYDKSKFNKDTDNIKNQTSYDKQCYNENTYSDNAKLYIELYNLYNEKNHITIL